MFDQAAPKTEPSSSIVKALKPVQEGAMIAAVPAIERSKISCSETPENPHFSRNGKLPTSNTSRSSRWLLSRLHDHVPSWTILKQAQGLRLDVHLTSTNTVQPACVLAACLPRQWWMIKVCTVSVSQDDLKPTLTLHKPAAEAP